MPRVVGKGGKVEHLPYTPVGMARAAAAKKRGAQVSHGPPNEEPMGGGMPMHPSTQPKKKAQPRKGGR